MTSGYQSLTEKEKETLRLLVNGYDAKSMARHLGLSVHTVNERLRDARRKMAVSSSREAARQLRDVESQRPEILGDRLLGDAAINGMKQHWAPGKNPGATRRSGWVIGGAVMSFSLALFAIMSLTGGTETIAPDPRSAASSSRTADAIAAASAQQWLAVVDRAEWNESWNATGQSFKSLNTSDRWAAVSETARRPLGAVLSRQFISEEFVPAPPYGYRNVRFKTSFANKPDAIETVSLVHEDERWKVVGYIIE